MFVINNPKGTHWWLFSKKFSKNILHLHDISSLRKGKTPLNDIKYQLCYLKRCLYTHKFYLFIVTSYFYYYCVCLPKGINECVVFLCTCMVLIFYHFTQIFIPVLRDIQYGPLLFFNSTVSYTYNHCVVDYRTTGILGY
jgi:hypothetical protein